MKYGRSMRRDICEKNRREDESVEAYQYEGDWRPYAFLEEKSGFASLEMIQNRYLCADMSGKLEYGGIPIWSDGKHVCLNPETVMTLILGGTGSGKSRNLIVQNIILNALAGESMVIMDIKGEFSTGSLSGVVRGTLEENGYQCFFLDYRTLEADGYNFLAVPYQMYRNGKKEEAAIMVNHVVKALRSIYKGSGGDPFWDLTASKYLTAVIMLLFEYCGREEQVNMLTLETFTTERGCSYMKEMVEEYGASDSVMAMLESVVSEPEKTRMSTLATVSSYLEVFLSNEKLLRMMSSSTFSVCDLFLKKTALFIIVPDEVDTYDRINGMVLQQISAALVSEAYQYGGVLPRRVNFICDEFCNYYIPNMGRNISAQRSRNIRWTLVCQGKKQLEQVYGREADVIFANCKNIYFLSSPEEELLEYIARKAGTTRITEDGTRQPVLTADMLRLMKRKDGYADVCFLAEGKVFVTKLPDISNYTCGMERNKTYTIPKKEKKKPEIYRPSQLFLDYERRG